MSLFLGRKWELDRLVGILERNATALIVLSGPPGKGKTTLMRAVREQAVQRGWKIVPHAPDEQVTIDRQTTRVTFANHLQAVLPSQDQEGFGRAEQRRAPIDPASRQPGQQGSSPAQNIDLPSPDTTLLRRIAQFEPLLILIDGYEPEASFERWLLGSFFSDLEQESSCTVAVIATERASVDDGRAETISLGTLDRAEVSEYFEALGRDLDPPMDETELDAYVTAACETPAVLDSLQRVLQLARRPDRRRDVPGTTP